MKIIEKRAYKVKGSKKDYLIVLVEDVGWMHIAKLPIDRDNIFFSKEELEIVIGVEFEDEYLKQEHNYEI